MRVLTEVELISARTDYRHLSVEEQGHGPSADGLPHWRRILDFEIRTPSHGEDPAFMDPALTAVLAMLAAAVVMFACGRPRMDAVALAAICSLPPTGVLTPAKSVARFDDRNVVLIAAAFVLVEGLVRTGVAQQLSVPFTFICLVVGVSLVPILLPL